MKRFCRTVLLFLFVLLFLAPAANFMPFVFAKAVPTRAQRNQSKRKKQSKTKTKLAKSKTHPLQRRQKKQRKKPT